MAYRSQAGVPTSDLLLSAPPRFGRVGRSVISGSGARADQSQPLWAALIPASKRLLAPRRSMSEDM